MVAHLLLIVTAHQCTVLKPEHAALQAQLENLEIALRLLLEEHEI